MFIIIFRYCVVSQLFETKILKKVIERSTSFLNNLSIYIIRSTNKLSYNKISVHQKFNTKKFLII